MPAELPTSNGNTAQDGENNFAVKAGLARMLKGGVIMDVVNAEQVRTLGEVLVELDALRSQRLSIWPADSTDSDRHA